MLIEYASETHFFRHKAPIVFRQDGGIRIQISFLAEIMERGHQFLIFFRFIQINYLVRFTVKQNHPQIIP